MNARENIRAALAQAHADREKAAADRAKAGANWRNQDDASVTYDKVRSNWVQADAEWNRASALIEKLGVEFKDLERMDTLLQQRTALEAALVRTRAERDKADTALAAVARARAEREQTPTAAPAPVERRGTANERRKPRSERRQNPAERRLAGLKATSPDSTIKDWNDAVSHYNTADAEWNRARAALAEFNRANSQR